MQNFRSKAMGIIFNKNAEILIAKYRTASRAGHERRAFPGGGRDDDETLKNALFREIKEELGIEKHDLKIIYEYIERCCHYYSKESLEWIQKNKRRKFKGKKEKFFVLYYLSNDFDIKLEDSIDFDEYKWIKIDHLKKYLESHQIWFLDLKRLKKLINSKLPQLISIR